MKRLLIALLCVLPLAAEYPDPGAGLATRAARRAARLADWQTTWEGLSAENKENAARQMLQDNFQSSCLLAAVREHSGEPAMSIPDAQEYIETYISQRNPDAVLDWLERYGCEPEPSYTPEEDDQGGVIHKTIVIRGTATAKGIRNYIPAFPRIGSVSSVGWGSMSHLICTVGVTDYDIYLSRHPWHEAHIDFLQSIVQAESAQANFYLVDSVDELGCDSITTPEP